MIRSSEVSGEQLWLLDEGHCFRDQLMRFCQLESAQSCQIAYSTGKHGNFHAHGRKRKRYHIYPRTSRIATQ